MNQRERDKFPRIYEIMQDIKGRISNDSWSELYNILNELEPDYELIAKQTNEFLKKTLEAYIDRNYYRFFGFPKELRHGWFNYSLVNYTKPLSINVKRAFIVVLGALGSVWFYLNDEQRQKLYKDWFIYRKNNNDFGFE